MKDTRTIQNILIGLLFLVVLAPLIVADSLFFPFIVGKVLFFRALVLCIFLGWGILALSNPSFRPKASPILFSFSFLVLVLIISTLAGVNPTRSMWSNFERMEGLVTHLYLFLYFLVLSSLITTKNTWKNFFTASIVASLIVSGYALLQLFDKLPTHQGDRMEGTLGNATYLAVYLLFHSFIALYYFFESNTRGWKVFYGSVAGLFPVLIFFTKTRGAVLGFLAGVLFILLVNLFLNQSKKVRKVCLGALLGALALIGGFILMRNTNTIQGNAYLKRLADISVGEQTARSRFMVWNMALDGFKERPIFGWGLENFNVVFNKHYNSKMYDQEPWFDRAHNVFFDWLITGGILGLLGYLAIFFTAFFVLFRQVYDKGKQRSIFSKFFSFINREPKKEHLLPMSILGGLLVSYFVQNIFVFDNIISYILFVSILAFIHTSVTDTNTTRNLFSEKPLLGGVLIGSIFFLALLFFFSAYHTIIKPIQANKTLITALTANNPTKGALYNLEKFNEALEDAKTGKAEIREQLLQMALRVAQAEQIPTEVKVTFLNRAYEEMKLEVRDAPLDARPAFFLGQFLRRLGRYEDAITYLSQAHELSPKKQEIYFELASTYGEKGETEKALFFAKEAFDILPENPDAFDFYIKALTLSGKRYEADALLKERGETRE